MKRRLAALALAPVLLLVVGCSQIQGAAQDAASDVASQAVTAASEEVQKQVCAIVGDGQISEQDRQTLSGLLAAATAAGVPAEFVTPLEEIADAGDQLPADAVTSLNSACGVSQ